MGCCEHKKLNTFDNPSENYICEILSQMKITKNSYRKFKNFLSGFEIDKENFDKFNFIKILKDEVIETDAQINYLNKMHLEIFEFLLSELEENFSKEKILLIFFPLLKNTSEDIKELVKDMKKYSDNKLNKTKVKSILKGIFEIFSLKMNNLIEGNSTNEDLNYNSHLMTIDIYNDRNIKRAIEDLVCELPDESKDLSIDLENLLKEKDVLRFEKIRDWIIQVKFERDTNY